jgi:hypothetical protein
MTGADRSCYAKNAIPDQRELNIISGTDEVAIAPLESWRVSAVIMAIHTCSKLTRIGKAVAAISNVFRKRLWHQSVPRAVEASGMSSRPPLQLTTSALTPRFQPISPRFEDHLPNCKGSPCLYLIGLGSLPGVKSNVGTGGCNGAFNSSN